MKEEYSNETANAVMIGIELGLLGEWGNNGSLYLVDLAQDAARALAKIENSSPLGTLVWDESAMAWDDVCTRIAAQISTGEPPQSWEGFIFSLINNLFSDEKTNNAS